jgi:hypothetical protein
MSRTLRAFQLAILAIFVVGTAVGCWALFFGSDSFGGKLLVGAVTLYLAWNIVRRYRIYRREVRRATSN